MMEITLTATAEAAHRIPILGGPGAKCRNVHGHSWRIEWTFDTRGIPLEDREFGAIKTVLRGWVADHFDHGYVCGPADDLGTTFTGLGLKVLVLPDWPTTENLAEYLTVKTRELVPKLTLTRLVLHEGPTNVATWSRERPSYPMSVTVSGGGGGAGGAGWFGGGAGGGGAGWHH